MRGTRHMLAGLVAGLMLLGLAALPAIAAREAACPEHRPLTVRDLHRLEGPDPWASSPEAHACFGASEVWIRAVVNNPDGLGGTSTSGIKPAVFEWPQLSLFGSTREVAPGVGDGPFVGIVVAPGSGRVERTFQGRWVDVVARFEHPYAERCRGWADVGEPLSKAEAVAICRDTLVLDSIRAATGPPTTDTAAPAAGGRSTPLVPLIPALLLAAALGAWLGWRRSRLPHQAAR